MATKNEHYVPQFYLRYFANGNGRVCAINRAIDLDKEQIYVANTRKICVRRNCYEVSTRSADESGKLFLEEGCVERALSWQEGEFAPRLQKLSKPGFLYCGGSPEIEEALDYAIVFVAHLLARSLVWQNEARSEKRSLAQVIANENLVSEEDRIELSKLGYAVDHKALAELTIVTESLFGFDEGSLIGNIASRLSEMSMTILECGSGSEFITGSFPILLDWEKEESNDPELVFFPLSPKTGLLFFGLGGAKEILRLPPGSALVEVLNGCFVSGNLHWEALVAGSRRSLEGAIDVGRSIAARKGGREVTSEN